MAEPENIPAFPLTWPSGWKRTTNRIRSKFKLHGADEVRRNMLHELQLLGATSIILSTNAPLRKSDNVAMADALAGWHVDPGVAVYFTRNKTNQVIACDKYSTPIENIHAIELCVDAMRVQQRHGSSEILDRAFTGFTALPPAPKDRTWWDILGVKRDAPLSVVKEMWLQGARLHHPDAGGDEEVMAMINRAWDDAQRERGGVNG